MKTGPPAATISISSRPAAASPLTGFLGVRGGVIDVTDAYVRSAGEEALAMYGTEDRDHPGVKYLLSRPRGLLGGPATVIASASSRASTPREIRTMARRKRWEAITGLATTAGLGCIEGVGVAGGALLATSPVALRHAHARDALLQAIALKNYGAREVVLEYERSDWMWAVSRLGGEDLGVVAFLAGARAAASLSAPPPWRCAS